MNLAWDSLLWDFLSTICLSFKIRAFMDNRVVAFRRAMNVMGVSRLPP